MALAAGKHAAEIEAAENAFYEAIEPIKGERIDVCMFPVDPRQGLMYDAGRTISS